MVNVSNHGEKLKGAPQGGRFDKESDLVDGLDLIYDAGQPLHAGRARREDMAGGTRRRFELSLRYMFGEGEMVGWLAEWNLTNPAD